MDLRGLADKYYDDITVSEVRFVEMDSGRPDGASITLRIPKRMREEYSALTGSRMGAYSSGVAFWKDTMLLEKLCGLDKQPKATYDGTTLADVLELLGGEVQVDFNIGHDDYDQMCVIELTRPYEDYGP